MKPCSSNSWAVVDPRPSGPIEPRARRQHSGPTEVWVWIMLSSLEFCTRAMPSVERVQAGLLLADITSAGKKFIGDEQFESIHDGREVLGGAKRGGVSGDAAQNRDHRFNGVHDVGFGTEFAAVDSLAHYR